MPDKSTAATAPRVLIYDIDRGLKSLADDVRIKEIFGYLPRRFIRTKSFLDLFTKMHKAEVVKTEDELGDILVEQFTMKGDVQIEVLDSITGISRPDEEGGQGRRGQAVTSHVG